MSFTLLRRSSIRKTLMGMLLLTSSTAVILAALGFVVNDWLSLRQSVFDQLRAQAGITGSNLGAAITFDDVEAAQKILNNFASEPEIVAATVFTAGGELFAHYQREGGGPTVPKPPRKPQGTLGENLYVMRPVVLQDDRIGDIMLISDLGYWRERRDSHLKTALGLILLSLIVSYVISRRMQRIVTRPIVRLASTARDIIEREDYSLRATKTSSDEIGELVSDFNAMLDRIQLRDAELTRARLQLEDKVEERTSELKQLTRMLEHQAFYDKLTGLANRSTFDDHLRMAISQCERYGGGVAVLFLDLDRFKIINDTLGHLIGDRLLVEVGRRFKKCLRDADTLARMGGDEFAVLVDRSGSEQAATEVAQKLISRINEPFDIQGYHLHITTSIGICLYPEDGRDAETIIKNADTAMYQSKDRGRNQFTFFAGEMNRRARRRLELETKLRKAIKNREFQIYYQPRLDTRTLRITGVEALTRWFDAGEGEIGPADFIPLAEECGLVSQIDDWVMETACREMQACFDEDLPDLVLSLNFSISQFIRKDLDEVISSVLRRTGYPGNKMELEITESLFGPETADTHELLKKIRRLGIEISIDDFGKAYSSLSRLKQLPLQTLKIDQSFVRDLGSDPDDEAIVRTIITMAHSLGLKVVAEGIETQAQFDFVKRHNCDAVQGFLFGRPLPVDEFRRQWFCQSTSH